MIFSARRSNTFGSRKKLVTLMSKSLARSSSSACVAAQNFEIAIHVIGLDRRHRHAPLDPALQRARLVKREIVGGLRAQQIDDLGQPIRRGDPVQSAPSCVPRQSHLPAVVDERRGNFGHRQHRSTAPVMIALRGMPS